MSATAAATAAVAATPKCNFFWKPNDYFGELSQWYKAPFVCDDDAFTTVDEFVMFQKAKVFGDAEMATKIIFGAYVHSSTYANMEREVKNFDQEVWYEHAFRTVVLANLCKFTQNERLREILMGTGDNVLIEINPQDKIWEIGFSRYDEWLNPNRYAAKKTGMAMMYARDLIRERLERGDEEPFVASSELPEMDIEAILKDYRARVQKLRLYKKGRIVNHHAWKKLR
ncbi:uncharacterized protein B0T15DRAFT_553637 [Chaetomium strumarium]|uniref:NADAR domain-containing protein n=1 Tax=Chaetomium strumarium TaxID=1170767 RepID=A0AAJ0M3A9_9PEZI|nr:hypothetical protein B0T15DRAFT_553637 [Chaetomium strumarium]